MLSKENEKISDCVGQYQGGDEMIKKGKQRSNKNVEEDE
jgi:hypothetical protein